MQNKIIFSHAGLMHARIDVPVGNGTNKIKFRRKKISLLSCLMAALIATNVESKKIVGKGQTYVKENQVTSAFDVLDFDSVT